MIHRPGVPGIGRILLDEMSQPEPMSATIVKRKTKPRREVERGV
jgi:hypothetical protein